MAKLFADAMTIGTIGFLTAAVFLLPNRGRGVEGLGVQAARVASIAAAGWSVSSAFLYLLNVSDVFAVPLNRAASWPFLSALATDASVGRALLGQMILAAAVAVTARITMSTGSLAIVLGVAWAGLLPVSLTGHSASAGSHDLAVVSLFLHLVGVTTWVGGLAATGWVAWRGSRRLPSAVQRYSTLALWAYAMVGVSGLVNAVVRVGSISGFATTSYGAIATSKLLALLALGMLGWRQRRNIVRSGGRFRTLATTELLVMAGAVGLAVALSRTPTPVPDDLLTPAEELLGGTMPAAPTVARMLWGWTPAGAGIAVVMIGTALYLAGVLALRRRGDAWPVGRSLSWLTGMVLIAWATVGGLGTYSHVLFSAHMVAHMVLSMVAPILLVLGAPMTLALRTLPSAREPGETSPRSLLITFLHSRFSRAMTHPLVAPTLFVGSLFGLYFSPLFEALMSYHVGHAIMQLHFLVVGSLFFYVIIGVDPAPRRLPHLARFGMLLVTIPFHAFFAIAVMSSTTVFGLDYWRGIERPYSTDLLADQYVAGNAAWVLGEIPAAIVVLALFVQWYRSDSREARRFDRSEAAMQDRDLAAYNAYLADLAKYGKRRDPR